jgi:hypothetical protein
MGLWLVHPVLAQSPIDAALLSLPVGQTLACHVPTPDPTAPVPANLELREFRVGNPAAGPIGDWPRRILVGADSAGRPVVLYDAVIRAPSGAAYVMAQFPPTGVFVGWRQDVAVDSAALAAMIAAKNLELLRSTASFGPQRPLDPAEQAKARALAAWLWARRCRKA